MPIKSPVVTTPLPPALTPAGGFYPYYLAQHQNRICRLLHVAGTATGLSGTLLAIGRRHPAPLLLGITAGYGLAWLGHFVFEKNRPATFRYPVQSLVGDLHFFTDVLRGKQKI